MITTTALLKKLRVKVICGASSNGRWRSLRSLTSTSSVMSSWRSGRGLQWQPVKLWWTSCPRGLRQCWKIMVTTQNIDTLSPIWTFSLRGVLTCVASGLDINGCVLSYFEGTENVHCCTIVQMYTSCTLTTLHCSKVSFIQCCHMKRYNTIFTKMWGVYSVLFLGIGKLGGRLERHKLEGAPMSARTCHYILTELWSRVARTPWNMITTPTGSPNISDWAKVLFFWRCLYAIGSERYQLLFDFFHAKFTFGIQSAQQCH